MGRPKFTTNMELVDQTESDPYMNLANAIVLQAVEDYKEIYCKDAVNNPRKRYKLRGPDTKTSIQELEDFFLSDWFLMLSNLNGKMFLQGLRRLCEEREATHASKAYIPKGAKLARINSRHEGQRVVLHNLG